MSKFIKWTDDYNRTAIRNIRCKLELGQLNAASVAVETLSKWIDKSTRTGVHFLQLQSKIAFKECNYAASYDFANQALKIATSKNMEDDIKRLEQLLRDILLKDPSLK